MAATSDLVPNTEEIFNVKEDTSRFPQSSFGIFPIKNTDFAFARSDRIGYITTNFVVLGNVDSGKSTTIGVLISGKLDDGNGRSRLLSFNYPHEKDTGRTSSISIRLLGFTAENNSVNKELFADSHRGVSLDDWPSIINFPSRKIVRLIDLCGHEKFFKTTVHGTLGSEPDYGILTVSAADGIGIMAKEHIRILTSAKIPFLLIITKIDITPADVYKSTLNQIRVILRVSGKKVLGIKTISNLVSTLSNPYVMDIYVPVIEISNKTGKNVDMLRSIIGLLPKKEHITSIDPGKNVAVITEKFYVKGVGTVASVMVRNGTFSIGDKIFIGPFSTEVSKINGKQSHFIRSTIKDIHKMRVPVKACEASENCTFLIKNVTKVDLRKGMVISTEVLDEEIVTQFTAKIYILNHQTSISVGFQPVINIGNVTQVARIIKIEDLADGLVLRSGGFATVVFEFRRAEFIVKSDPLFIREGKMRAIGKIL